MFKEKIVAGLVAWTALAAAVPSVRPAYDHANFDKKNIAPYALEDPLAFADGHKLNV